ncbi:MAG TPA: HDOD domain-containing protein [Candidatus Saccharimonadales bacterium]|nr:HDOD domain-containing protein [Candidatus Saccharimonadales bacterium]
MHMAELQQKVEHTPNLPSLPVVVTKIIAAVDDPNSSVSRLNDLISQEPALAARMLRLANSAYFGRRNGLVSLPQCALVLGFNTIRSLALSASVHQMVVAAGVKSFQPQEFWRHSLGTGVGARVLARASGQDGEAAMSAGLVHDIGKLVLDVVAGREYEQVLVRAQAGEAADAVETELLGATHGDVGGWLAAKWKLPDVIVAAISHHHRPASAEVQHQPLVFLVGLSDAIAHALTLNRPVTETDAVLWQSASVPYERADELGAEFLKEWKLAEEVMGTADGEVARAA